MASTLLIKRYPSQAALSFPCKLCSKVFQERSKFKRHIKEIHSNNTEIFNCELCPKVFKRKEHLSRHLRCIHFKVKYACPLCPKKYGEKARLKRHLRSKHELTPCKECGILSSNDTDHKSEFCEEKYNSLTASMVKHGVLFTCNDCYFSFFQKQALKNHICKGNEAKNKYRDEMGDKTNTRHKLSKLSTVKRTASPTSSKIIKPTEI